MSILGIIALLFSLFLGCHFSVLFIIGGEIVSEVPVLKLSVGCNEKISDVLLLMPVVYLVSPLGLYKLVESGFDFMKKLKYNHHKSVRRVGIFSDIPISVEEAALKLSNLCKQKSFANLSREYLWLKISFDEEG